MKLLRIAGNSILNAALRNKAIVSECCSYLWLDSFKWSDRCLWVESDSELWDNNELWSNNSLWPK